MITVVAAIIRSGQRLLICQRKRNDRFGLKWEFPGGKAEPNERPEDALRRELREELGVEANIGGEVYRTRHRYSELDHELELIFYSASIPDATVENLAFEQVVWADSSKLEQYDFLPADRELVGMLARGELKIT